MTKDEALKLALMALKKCRYRSLADEIVDPAIAAIEEVLAQPSDSVEQEPLARFNCWSTNHGDSWFENPADADLIYEMLGEEPKVGDEFEILAGRRYVPARYRVTKVTEDEDCEVDCISHPNKNTTPPAQRQPLTDEEIMAIGKELGLKCRLGGNPNIDFDFARAIEAKLKE